MSVLRCVEGYIMEISVYVSRALEATKDLPSSGSAGRIAMTRYHLAICPAPRVL
jgi:hypothetical protein